MKKIIILSLMLVFSFKVQAAEVVMCDKELKNLETLLEEKNEWDNKVDSEIWLTLVDWLEAVHREYSQNEGKIVAVPEGAFSWLLKMSSHYRSEALPSLKTIRVKTNKNIENAFVSLNSCLKN